MKLIISALTIASLFSSYAGADVFKVRVSGDTYRIVLTGQDAQRLFASVGKNAFVSSSSLDAMTCNDLPRCEITLKAGNVQSYATIQEQLRLAQESGTPVPQMTLPRNPSEQLLTAQIEDSAAAERLYKLMPGPEVVLNLDRSIRTDFAARDKTLDLARNDFFMSCQEIERVGSAAKKGYRCTVSAIVPAQGSTEMKEASLRF